MSDPCAKSALGIATPRGRHVWRAHRSCCALLPLRSSGYAVLGLYWVCDMAAKSVGYAYRVEAPCSPLRRSLLVIHRPHIGPPVDHIPIMRSGGSALGQVWSRGQRRDVAWDGFGAAGCA